MRVREYLQEDSIDIGCSGTKVYDLEYIDPISQLDLFFKATNGASSNIGSPFERCISKIELVDGGEVLWDLPGEVAMALFAHDAGALPYSELEEVANASVRQQIPIRFGRWLYDPEYAFDPRRHTHPQLRFTFDEAAVNTAGATGYVSDSWEFTLGVKLMEGALTPKGFLSARTVESFTSVAGGARRVELPTDRVIRLLMCRAYESAVPMYTNITNHQLTADGGKWVGFNLPARDFLNLMCENFGPISRTVSACITDSTAWETFMGINNFGLVSGWGPGNIAGAEWYIYSQIMPYYTTHAGVALTRYKMFIKANGWALHNTLIYPFGDRMKPEDWLDPVSFGKLDYVVTDGDAGADCDIAVQQVYRY